MDPAHVVLLIAVFIAVAAIAGYLIAITLILKHVVNRLVTILGAVQATTDASMPAGAVIADINKDLDAGRRLMEDCVQRLEDSREPVGATAGSTSRHEVAEPAPDPRGGGLSTAALPPTPGPAPPATTLPSTTGAAPARAGSGTEEEEDLPGQTPQERKRGWWSR